MTIRCRSGGQGERERWSVLQDRGATQRGGGEHEATVTSKPQQRERKTEGKEKREMWEKSVFYKRKRVREIEPAKKTKKLTTPLIRTAVLLPRPGGGGRRMPGHGRGCAAAAGLLLLVGAPVALSEHGAKRTQHLFAAVQAEGDKVMCALPKVAQRCPIWTDKGYKHQVRFVFPPACSLSPCTPSASFC